METEMYLDTSRSVSYYFHIVGKEEMIVDETLGCVRLFKLVVQLTMKKRCKYTSDEVLSESNL